METTIISHYPLVLPASHFPSAFPPLPFPWTRCNDLCRFFPYFCAFLVNFYEFLEKGGEFQPQEGTSTYQSASGWQGGGEQTRTTHNNHQQEETLSDDQIMGLSVSGLPNTWEGFLALLFRAGFCLNFSEWRMVSLTASHENRVFSLENGAPFHRFLTVQGCTHYTDIPPKPWPSVLPYLQKLRPSWGQAADLSFPLSFYASR